MKAYRPEKHQSTRARLANALAAASAPAVMIEKALAGVYDDYLSELAAPIYQLILDATAAVLPGIVSRARAGEFDGTKAEAEAWAHSPEGRTTFAELRQGLQRRPPP